MEIKGHNTLEDILECIHCLEIDINEDAPEFPISPQFDELIARIEQKLNRNSNKIRQNWFTSALEHAKNARESFHREMCEECQISLVKCRTYLEQGNKAHRRKASIIVDRDGNAEDIQQ